MDFQICIRGYCPLYWWTWFYRRRIQAALPGRTCKGYRLGLFFTRALSDRIIAVSPARRDGRRRSAGIARVHRRGYCPPNLTLPTLPDTHLFLSQSSPFLTSPPWPLYVGGKMRRPESSSASPPSLSAHTMGSGRKNGGVPQSTPHQRAIRPPTLLGRDVHPHIIPQVDVAAPPRRSRDRQPRTRRAPITVTDRTTSIYPREAKGIMAAPKPAGQPQLLFVDGSFEDLATEMADYLKAEDAKQLLSQDAKPSTEDVVAKLVAASNALNTVSEKEYTAASNLMIHLVLQSSDPKKYLPTLCSTFAKPLVNSPVHGAGLSLNALTTVFNLLAPTDPVRARVFMEILKFLRAHGMYESLRQYLDKLPEWLESWGTEVALQRQIYEEVAEVALEAGAQS